MGVLRTKALYRIAFLSKSDFLTFQKIQISVHTCNARSCSTLYMVSSLFSGNDFPNPTVKGPEIKKGRRRLTWKGVLSGNTVCTRIFETYFRCTLDISLIIILCSVLC
jgi:hypothetical protein